MNAQKKNQGFTLVEVIVVAVIVAVLAAVAIPMYTGYVKDSRKNAANNAAASMASFLSAARNTAATVAGVPGTHVSGTTLTAGTNKDITIPANITIITTGPVAAGGRIIAINTAGPDTSEVYTW